MIKKKILCFQEGEDLVPQVLVALPGTWYGTGIKYQAQPQARYQVVLPGTGTYYW